MDLEITENDKKKKGTKKDENKTAKADQCNFLVNLFWGQQRRYAVSSTGGTA